MSKITQLIFDEAVKENMQEFEMDVEEAIKDTVKQFEMQGVDLSNIIVDLMANKIDAQPVIEAVTELANGIKEKKNINECMPHVIKIGAECNKGLEYRVIAAREGAYNVLLDFIKLQENNTQVLIDCYKTMTILMTKQPDLLDKEGINNIINVLDKSKNEDVIEWVLKWTRECCILHEKNRQEFMTAKLLDHLKPLLDHASNKIIIQALGILRALVLDDDVRVEFGNAHEHARVIASDTLCALTRLLEKFKADQQLMNELLMTLVALLVRTEFCKKVEEAGGIEIIKSALIEFGNSDAIVRNVMKVLKALAGNDSCKANIIKAGLAPLIISALDKQQKSMLTGTAGLACIAALALRSRENSDALFKCGAAKTVVNIMKNFPENENIQCKGSWAIRNMVCRNKEQTDEWVSLDIENILHNALKKFKNSEYDIKAALRDLELKVELKEEWTGKGGKLTTEATAK